MTKKKKRGVQSNSDAANEKLCAILSYLLIGIIWYFVDEKIKKSNFVKHHVKQGIILLIAWIIYDLVLGLIAVPIAIVSFGALLPLLNLLYVIPIIWVIIGMIAAGNDKEKELPLIGKFAEKLKF